MMKEPLIIGVLGLMVALAGGATAADQPEAADRVTYVITFESTVPKVSNTQITQDTTKYLLLCFQGRCTPFDTVSQPCRDKLCEMVHIVEIPIALNRVKYQVQNTFGNQPQHEPLRTKDVDYKGLDPDAARPKLLELLRRRLVCHDHTVHGGPETQQCKCDPL